MTDKLYKVIRTEAGQQIPVIYAPGVSVSFQVDGDEIRDEIELDVTEQEFADIRTQALTNSIPADILRDKKVE